MTSLPPRHRWLLDLTHLPSTSGHEHRVMDWVETWASRRPELAVKTDPVGNRLLRIKGRKRHSPVIAAAHTDHPGFVVSHVKGRRIEATFMGGVLAPYFDSAPVVFFDESDDAIAGTVAAYDPKTSLASIRLSQAAPALKPGDIGRWRFPARSLGISKGRLRAPACDDLAGVASSLAALDRARKDPRLSHFQVLLTRGEEEGFLGAIGACKAGSIPEDARLLSIETSRCFPDDSPIGAGPIVRVGDASSVFDRELTNAVTEVARSAGLPHQRKLMAGGSCEATAFSAYGHRATGLCLALGNYHNMIDIDGVRAGASEPRLGPEEISLEDFDGLVSLLLAVARDIDDVGSDLVDRLDRRFEQSRGVLGI